MLIIVTDRGDVLDESAHRTAERRLRFALSRFDNRVSRLELVVDDENGPRGGIDKSCRLVVKLRREGEVVISDVDSEIGRCIARVAERAARAVARSIERAQAFDRCRAATPPPTKLA